MGHICKFCESPAKCLTYADHQLTKERPCELIKKCINCGGPHNTPWLPNIPKTPRDSHGYIATFGNLPFLEAHFLVERGESFTRGAPIKTLMEFPVLLIRKMPTDVGRMPSQISKVGNDANSNVLLKEVKGNIKNKLDYIIDAILSDLDSVLLCKRIKKAIDLHVSNNKIKKVDNISMTALKNISVKDKVKPNPPFVGPK